MAYTSLYRKYRPQDFESMIGQQHIRQTLKNAIKSGSIAHAYLFTGTRGTGKTSTAKIFAKAINCSHPKEDGSPCGKCDVCKELSSINNLDIIELDAASNNSVEDIRGLIEKVKYAPTVGKYKVYIVDEVHMLSPQAFNAFLKTLEEPPEHVVFILATTEVQKIPATILSRCIRFDFRLISKEELALHIAKIFDDLKVKYEKEAIYQIAEAGNGSVRDALSIADMVLSYCGENVVTFNSVLEVLGSSSPMHIVELCDYIFSSKTSSALALANSLLNMGKSVNVLADDIAKMMNNILFAKNCDDAQNILGLPLELYSKIRDVALPTSNYKITRATEIFTEIQNTLRYSSLSKIVLETAIAKAADIQASIDTTSIIKRILELEAFERTMKGANTQEGTTVTGPLVWGRVLIQLGLDDKAVVEKAAAARVKMDDVKIEDRTLVLTIKEKALYDELAKYKDFIYRYVVKDYMEIKGIDIKLVGNEKETIKEEIKDLFD